MNCNHMCFSAISGLHPNLRLAKQKYRVEGGAKLKKSTHVRVSCARGPEEVPSLRYPQELGSSPLFIYENDFLPSGDRDTMLQALKKLTPKLKKDHSFATKRKSALVPVTSPAYALWTGKQMRERLQALTQPEAVPGDFPMEIRLYPLGASMDWHVDDLMYQEPQYELVYTLDNTSDSYTEFEDSSGRVHSIWAQPNSLLVIRAAGVRHRVTTVSEGERSIIKFLYTTSYDKTELYSQVLDSAPWRR